MHGLSIKLTLAHRPSLKAHPTASNMPMNRRADQQAARRGGAAGISVHADPRGAQHHTCAHAHATRQAAAGEQLQVPVVTYHRASTRGGARHRKLLRKNWRAPPSQQPLHGARGLSSRTSSLPVVALPPPSKIPDTPLLTDPAASTRAQSAVAEPGIPGPSPTPIPAAGPRLSAPARSPPAA
jgi:hypothetical protein